MNTFELFGFFILGALFNVVILVIGIKSVIKTTGGQVTQILDKISAIFKKVVENGQ